MLGRSPRTLIIFAREPSADTAKTRLSPMFDGPARVKFYLAMLRDVAASSRAAACDRRVLAWAPGARPALLEDIFSDHELTPQRGEDLGSRMAAAFAEAFATDAAARGVRIGSDAPLLDGPRIDAAWDLLERRDIALTPSHDGGYCLVGARASVGDDVATLFDAVRWSEPDVLAQTVDRAQALAERRPEVTCGILPMCYDIDTPDDVRRLEAHLRALEVAEQPLPRHTLGALRRLR